MVVRLQACRILLSIQNVMQLSGLGGLCKIDYVRVNHDMLSAFVQRLHSETSSFHLPCGEIFITLDDVSCLLHLPIRGRLLDHGRNIIDEIMEMMVNYLGIDPGDALQEIKTTRGCHARFRFLERLYIKQLHVAEKDVGDDEQVMQHRAYTLRAYMLYLVGTFIFVDKSVTYVDVVYLRYFADLEQIHEYNWGGRSCGIHVLQVS